MYTIYNHSSVEMRELANKTVDLAVVAPPYNIGTVYGENLDTLPFSKYVSMMHSVIGECFRVLKDDGVMVIEAADSVSMNGKYVALAGLLQRFALDAGFFIIGRDINFVHSKERIELPEDSRWDHEYVADSSAHSNCHQLMTFSKKSGAFRLGRVLYMDYAGDASHPCPFPLEAIRYLLENNYRGGVVLEPFMGTARLGKAVLAKGGQYIGYEIDSNIFEAAKKNLSEE